MTDEASDPAPSSPTTVDDILETADECASRGDYRRVRELLDAARAREPNHAQRLEIQRLHDATGPDRVAVIITLAAGAFLLFIALLTLTSSAT